MRGLQPTRGGHPSRRHRCHSTCCSQGALVVKSPPANAADVRDAGPIPGSGRSRGGGHGKPLQYSCLENLMDRGAWWATVHGVAKSRTRLKRLGMNTHSCAFSGTSVHLILPEAPGWARFAMSTGGSGSEASPHSPPAGRCGERRLEPRISELVLGCLHCFSPLLCLPWSFLLVDLNTAFGPNLTSFSSCCSPFCPSSFSQRDSETPWSPFPSVVLLGDAPSSAWLPGVCLPVPTTLCQRHWPDVDPWEPGCFRHRNGVFRLTSLLQSGGRKGLQT